MKKCKKCGAPLEGFLYNTIGKLMGIKPSESDPEICNKCVDAPEQEPQASEETSQEPAGSTEETPVEPEASQPEEVAPVQEPEAPAESEESSSAEASDDKKEETV